MHSDINRHILGGIYTKLQSTREENLHFRLFNQTIEIGLVKVIQNIIYIKPSFRISVDSHLFVDRLWGFEESSNSCFDANIIFWYLSLCRKQKILSSTALSALGKYLASLPAFAFTCGLHIPISTCTFTRKSDIGNPRTRRLFYNIIKFLK